MLKRHLLRFMGLFITATQLPHWAAASAHTDTAPNSASSPANRQSTPVTSPIIGLPDEQMLEFLGDWSESELELLTMSDEIAIPTPVKNTDREVRGVRREK